MEQMSKDQMTDMQVQLIGEIQSKYHRDSIHLDRTENRIAMNRAAKDPTLHHLGSLSLCRSVQQKDG